MAEVIQFHCPSCGMMLRLPLAFAGSEGPCPGCHRDIVAPDPHRGVGARVAESPPPPPPPAPDPIKPFAESPPLVPRGEPVAKALEPAPAARPGGDKLPPPRGERLEPRTERLSEQKPIHQPAADAATAHRPMTFVACVLSGLVGIAIGYVIGTTTSGLKKVGEIQSVPEKIPAQGPKPLAPPVQDAVPPVIKAPVAPPAPEPIPPTLDPDPAPPESTPADPPAAVDPPQKSPEPPPAEPAKTSAAAEAALKAFLAAPDWAARSAYVLSAETMREAMESYSHEAPDGPTPFRAIELKHSQIDPKTGATVYVFYVKTDAFPDGLPVAIKETTGGWLADWPAFVEFRDNLFQKFLDGPFDATGRFHLIVSKPSAGRAASTESENFAPVLLQSPLIGKPQLAFVKKSTDAGDTVQLALDAGGVFSPVLEVVKKKTPEGKPYFEIVKVVANDWFPREPAR